ncbi:MAG: ATP-binding protein [Lachnospiraceae bacterium]|nr:ATP-binding protein [Lachnospiraceae bacterium]
MSAYLNNIFNFGRPLPEPFDTLANKKVGVSSIYGDGTTATLCSTVIKAVHAVCHCMDGSGEGAVGVIDHRTVAEYKSSMGPDSYHLVVYDSKTGALMASVYDNNTETFENYVLNSAGRDGAAVMMALFPVLMKDKEFKEKFDEYRACFASGYPDLVKATECMAILCDNVYRRVKDDTCAAAVTLNVDKTGNLMRVSQVQLDSGAFTPSEVLAGEFCIFAKTARVTVKRAGTLVAHEDFIGKYQMRPRALSETEEALVPKLPEWYIIPQEAVDICRHAQATTGKPTQMRNFLLRGPAGTGKTMGAKAIAAGLNLPYMKYTCSAGTEIFDFVGQLFPDSESGSTGDERLDQEREILKSMGGINYANIAKLMELPDLDDMDYDPAGVYQALTGMEKGSATAQDCMGIVLDRVTEKVRALSRREENAGNSGQAFTYIETDFIKALKNGYLIELQEPSTIVQPGVLVGLNSLLEQGGSVTLPTGEVITRHPDAVVVVTTNISYEGCRGLNQSVIDRMSLVRDVELPTPEVMAQRAMSITGASDEIQVARMVQVVNDLSEYCRKNSITDGSYGMRGLIDWITSSEITGDVYQSALYTVISKATTDEEDREALVSTVLEPVFRPAGRGATA